MQNKWEDLAQNLHQESALLGERNTPENLKHLVESDFAVTLEIGGNIIGFAALWETGIASWRELGSVWIHPKYRDKGLSNLVFTEVLHLARKYKTFLITHNPKVVHLALACGWQELDQEKWSEVPLEITCGPCDRVKGLAQFTCPFKAKPEECRLFCSV